MWRRPRSNPYPPDDDPHGSSTDRARVGQREATTAKAKPRASRQQCCARAGSNVIVAKPDSYAM
eukprot:3136723-Lingulodinium_polyedra.AAC.1